MNLRESGFCIEPGRSVGFANGAAITNFGSVKMYVAVDFDRPTSQHASGEDGRADGASVMIGIPALEPEPSWDDEPTDPYMFSTHGPWGIFPAQPVAASYVEPGQKLEGRTCKQCKNVGSMKVIKEELTFYAFCRLCGRKEEL